MTPRSFSETHWLDQPIRTVEQLGVLYRVMPADDSERLLVHWTVDEGSWPYMVMAWIVMVYVALAHIVHIVMAYIAMAYTVMAYIVMADDSKRPPVHWTVDDGLSSPCHADTHRLLVARARMRA